MSKAPKTLLLDVMDTLVKDPFWDAVPGFFGLSLEQLLAQKHPTAWLEFERGERTREQYYREMFLDRRRFDHAAFEARVRQAYRFLPGVEPLLQRLARQSVEMHALSNYPVWYEMLDRTLGLSRYVAWTFVSCKTGVRKPDPEAYLGALRALGRPPEECVFVDDRDKNCEAARALGIPTLVFVSAERLEADLVRLGVLPRE